MAFFAHRSSSASSEVGYHASTHESTGADTIAIDTLGPATDILDLNVSTTAHGLLPKLSNVTTEYLDGKGNWSTASGVSLDSAYISGNVIDVDGSNVIFKKDDVNEDYKVSSVTYQNTTIATIGLNQWVAGLALEGSVWHTGEARDWELEGLITCSGADGNPPWAGINILSRVQRPGTSASWVRIVTFRGTGEANFGGDIKLELSSQIFQIGGSYLHLSGSGKYFNGATDGDFATIRSGNTTNSLALVSLRPETAGRAGIYSAWRGGTNIEPVGYIHRFGWIATTGTNFKAVGGIHGNGDLEINGHALIGAQNLFGTVVEEDIVIDNAATTSSTAEIPAGAVVLGVTTRIKTQPGGSSTMDVGITGTAQLFTTGMNTAATTTDQGINGFGTAAVTAKTILFTPDATSDNAGRVTIVISYYLPTPATS